MHWLGLDRRSRARGLVLGIAVSGGGPDPDGCSQDRGVQRGMLRITQAVFRRDRRRQRTQVVDICRLQEVRVPVQQGHQVIGILMTGAARQIAPVGVVDDTRRRAAVAMKGVVAVRAGGIGVIQVSHGSTVAFRSHPRPAGPVPKASFT